VLSIPGLPFTADVSKPASIRRWWSRWLALVVFAFLVWAVFASGLFIRIIDPFVQWYTSQMHFGPTQSPSP